ncbi:MAG: hypothetical protein ACI9P7_000668 [Candidatus Azotimanducaceae bacterium]|jgi:hypothetical protein
MLKILGLSGARCVTPVSSIEDRVAYLQEFDDNIEVILKEKLDPDRYTALTVDLLVTDKAISISNVRKILFADGIWVGNQIGPDVVFSEEHAQRLIRIGEYARQQGYTAVEGYNWGVGYFISDDDFKVTEINARWTGGLFPAEMIRLVGAQAQTCVAFVDLVREDKFDTHLSFVERHIYGRGDPDFLVIPLGASAIVQTIEGVNHYFAWQVIAGNFEAFKIAADQSLAMARL